jgi:hypothetical protein
MRIHALAFLLLAGCAAPVAAHPDTTLGRVVVYKSGVAYFERYATIDDDVLRLSVPAAQMDDFLKSLTVVDETTGAPAPIAYPRSTASDSGMVELEVRLSGPRPHRLKLSYITESPSWKPTYRAVLGSSGKVSFEGWAIVDNDSSEDWRQVKLGVGSSSALSFRFDLRSRRSVEREQLTASDRFAVAPPTGEAPYGAEPGEGQGVVGELADEAVAPARDVPAEATEVSVVRIENAQGVLEKQVANAKLQRDAIKVLCLQDKANQLESLVRMARDRRKAAEASDYPSVAEHDRSVIAVLRQRGDQLLAEANQCIGQEAAFVGETQVTTTIDPSLPPEGNENLAQYAKRYRESAAAAKRAQAPAPPPPAPPPKPPQHPSARPATDFRAVVEQIRARPGHVTIEGYARPDDAEPMAAALGRATRARELLVAAGIAPDRLTAVAKGRADGKALVRFVRVADHGAASRSGREGVGPGSRGAAARALAEPIGASHFESPLPLTIAHGASAMISIVKGETEGEVVYLYDAESARGNATFPFRAVRLVNPTDSTLESGPVTVFGEGRFVGEGLCEPIPARSAGFIPFALDRQVIADARTAESDSAPRLVGAEGDVLTTEVERTRRTVVTLHNRQREATTVFARHTVPAGYDLRRAPAERERVAGAYLFKVSVPASGKVDVEIEETSAIVTASDVWSPEGFEAARLFVASAPPGLVRDKLGAIVKLAEEAGALQQKLTSTRAWVAEERKRADRLREQIASLRTAHTSQPLLAPLDRKLDELDRQLSRATVDAVALDERLAVIRVRVSDASHQLRLEPKGGEGSAGGMGGGGEVRSR